MTVSVSVTLFLLTDGALSSTFLLMTGVLSNTSTSTRYNTSNRYHHRRRQRPTRITVDMPQLHHPRSPFTVSRRAAKAARLSAACRPRHSRTHHQRPLHSPRQTTNTTRGARPTASRSCRLCTRWRASAMPTT